jgi:peptidoglycan/xylan/chitin deacetylase (PgdA/CDA1 family)
MNLLKSNTVILSFDLDGKRAFEPYDKLEKDFFLEYGIPRIVEFLKQRGLDATFFIVGQNLEDFSTFHEPLKCFDIGNHSYSHPNLLTKKNISEKRFEIEKAHILLKEFFGSSPQIFRAPNYQVDGEIIEILKELDYKGDSSLIKVLYPLLYFINYRKQRKLADDDFEFPLISFLIPFNGTSVIIYGFSLSKRIFIRLLKRNKVIIINFHDRDFVNVRIHEPGFVRRKKSLETTLQFLNYIDETCNIFSFRQAFDNGIFYK